MTAQACTHYGACTHYISRSIAVRDGMRIRVSKHNNLLCTARIHEETSTATDEVKQAQAQIHKETRVNKVDSDGATPRLSRALFYAAKKGNEQLVKKLLDKKAEYLTKNQSLALQIAVKQNNEAIIELLLEQAKKDDIFDKVEALAIRYANKIGKTELATKIKNKTKKKHGCLIM